MADEFKVVVAVVVKVPEPLNVPLRVIDPPLLLVGFAPIGNEQLELTVLVPEV